MGWPGVRMMSRSGRRGRSGGGRGGGGGDRRGGRDGTRLESLAPPSLFMASEVGSEAGRVVSHSSVFVSSDGDASFPLSIAFRASEDRRGLDVEGMGGGCVR